jgi:amino acid adenylation domain-containing protein
LTTGAQLANRAIAGSPPKAKAKILSSLTMEFVHKDSAARSGLCSPRGFVEFLVAECDQPIDRRFERQAILCPEAPAVRLLSGDVNYAELNIAANRAARMLLANVATDARPIALMLDQGYESILWTLAILKAGRCYAPLDQRLPESLLRAITDDLAPGALIAGIGYQDAGRSLAAGRFPVIGADTACDRFAAENLDQPVTADSIAYVFYTSGSTGTPKGVADSHRNVLHNIMRYTNSLKFAPGDVMSLVQHPRFSGTVSSLFGALLNGAAIAPFDLQAEGLQTISQWLRLARVTVFHAVPSIFRQLSDPGSRFPDIRLIRLEGDRAAALDIKHFRKNFQDDDCTLVNGFGATECGLGRQFFIGKHTALDAAEPIPIGYAVADMAVRIVDEQGQELPCGSAGEIVVESRFLATGYWRNPVLTADRFVALPDGVRHYRSGDLGRMSEDGCLTYLGRVDHQIRIAGEFVAAADIEKLLLEVPGISQAVVRDFVDQTGERRLCAYLVADVDAGTTVTRLREWLSERIAKQLVPTDFVFLDALPLTNDLKIDYQRLPQPGRRRPPLPNAYVAPRTTLEQELVQIWQDVLDKCPIGIHDNFFDLGGDSLLAARLFVEIEKSIGKIQPLATIYQAPTIERLAAILAQEEWSLSQFSLWSTYPSSVVPFQPNGSKPPLFWFEWGPWDFRLPQYLGSDQPVYGLQHQSQDGRRARHTSIEQMAAHYIEEMRAVRAKGPYFLGGLCIGGMVTFEMARQLQQQGEEVPLVVLLDPDPTNPFAGELSPGIEGASRVSRFGRKISRHLRELAPLGPQEKLSYALVRVKNRIMVLHGKISWFARRVLYQAFGRSLPLALRTYYLWTIYQRAARLYVPKYYQGRVILFKTQGRYRDGEFGWGKQIAEWLEIHELDTDHNNVFKEPYVQIFAKKLKTRLSEAEKNASARGNSTVDFP